MRMGRQQWAARLAYLAVMCAFIMMPIVFMASKDSRIAPVAASASMAVARLQLTMECHDAAMQLDCLHFDWQPPSFIGTNILGLLSAQLEALDQGLNLELKNCEHDILNLGAYAAAIAECPHQQNVLVHRDIGGAAYAFHHTPSSGMVGSPPIENGTVEEWRFPWFAPCVYRRYTTALFKERLKPLPRIDFANSLIIHFRAGDTFGPSPSPAYGPPPLSFYVDAIERNPGKAVVIVTNDKGGYASGKLGSWSKGQASLTDWVDSIAGSHPSPLVSLLLEQYPQATLVSNSLAEDASLLVQAQHLVVSQGTFSYGMALCSRALQSFYVFGSGGQRLPLTFTDVDVHRYRAPGYFVHWMNSPEQREVMVSYPRDKLQHSTFRRESSKCVVQ